MTTDREAELIFELAERYGMTTLDVVRMARLVCYGPLADRMYQETGIYEPGEDERVDALRIAKRLAERPPISELMEIWRHCHEICVWQCEREPDLAKRAAMFTALREAEQQMDAIRERAREMIERGEREKIEVLGKGAN
jgi:hypothetical protein